MRHTLVARFEPKDFDSVDRCLMGWKGKTINKIPFGRNCDREEANRILPFHMTLLHWGRSSDSYMLQRMNALSFSPVTVTVTGPDIMYAEENSFIYGSPLSLFGLLRNNFVRRQMITILPKLKEI